MPLSAISTNSFTVTRDIRFSNSDPAGIVFYAEFFRMLNDLFEDWLVNRLGIDFAHQFDVEQRMFPLGHADITSTQRYLHVGVDQGREELNETFRFNISGPRE